jgi:hypothetical protein
MAEIDLAILTEIEWIARKLGKIDPTLVPRKANWLDPDPPAPAPDWEEASQDFVDEAGELLQTPAPVLGPPPGGWKEAAEKFAASYTAEPEAKPQASATWQDANKIFTKNFKGGLTHD